MKCMSIDCEKIAVSRGCCDKHYRRLLKTGDINNNGNRVVDDGDDTQRFHKKYTVSKNGCWLWKAGTRPNSKGILYPRHHTQSGSQGAHRFSYSIHVGKIPKGMMVCHKCDTPLCVNPDHLFIGTHKDNMTDMVYKNRSHKGIGEKANRSKLTNKQAQEIRSLCLSQTKIAEMYKVSQATIGRIIRQETYR